MDFLIANSGKRGPHHEKAVKPRPPLNKMKPRRAREHDARQGHANQSQVAENSHEALPLSCIQNCPTITDYKTKKPSALRGRPFAATSGKFSLPLPLESSVQP